MARNMVRLYQLLRGGGGLCYTYPILEDESRKGKIMDPGIGAFLVEILLVEDEPQHVILTEEVLRRCKFKNNVTISRNGQDAMAILKREGAYAETPRPDLILLDLNLPGKDGREVLSEIRKDPQLKSIPVIILSASHEQDDILKAFQLDANGYVAKPFELGKFLEALRSIEEFGLGILKLSGRPGSPARRS